ncbi:MAG TPA: PhzF family phenazine biosynthesis protein [Gemmatimonadaceae bacterium]|nr:PhzF family phenazine biosynthesis protein [Gemmatimonadaceae bacterium]
MPRFRFLTADVFTDTPFGGNPLAVFPDARGIPEHRLQDVAREFNLSETTFVFPASDQAHTRRVRIFTPGTELAFAGHPTVGTAHVLAAIGEIPLSGESTRIVLEELVGPVPVTIRADGGRPVYCELTAAKVPEEGPPPPAREALARVLGLEPADLLDGDWSPRAWTCGVPYLFVPVRDRAAVARSRVDTEAWERTLAGTWAPEIFVFAREGERAGSDLHGRMYAPVFGIAEDPATGSAAAALAGYLARRDARRDGTLRWRLEQGFEMKRPSILDIEADLAGGEVTGVRVGGASVVVSEGTMLVEP